MWVHAVTLHEEIARLLDGDIHKAKAIIEALSHHVSAEARRIVTENVPALRAFGGDWCLKEARFRELAALFVREWATTLELDQTLVDLDEQLAESKALRARVSQILKEHYSPCVLCGIEVTHDAFGEGVCVNCRDE